MNTNPMIDIYRSLRVPDEDWERGKRIASELGETELVPRSQIARIVHFCGEDFANKILERAKEVYNAGGMKVHNGKRKRTLGGVFFYLARGEMSDEQRKDVFPHLATPEFRNLRHKYVNRPVFTWDTRKAIVTPLFKSSGKAIEVIVRIVGHPGRFEKRREVVVVTMKHEVSYPDLAADMPPLPEEPTIYTVYIPSKHWKKIEPGLKDQKRLLDIEGIGVFDAEIGGIVVYANVARLRKVKDRATGEDGESDEAEKSSANAAGEASAKTETSATKDAPQPAKKTVKKSKAAKSTSTKKAAKAETVVKESPAKEETAPAEEVPPLPPAPTKIEAVIPEDAPQEIKDKLNELYTAAHQYYDKIMAMRAQPDAGRFGIEMTQKLLTSVEKQISELLTKHQ